MAERIYKLQPNRTMALRGFDQLGASGAMHSASADSFTVEGNFRDAADFCVLMVWDVDNFYEHPSLKYLPDPSFNGLVLSFDVQYTGLQPLDSNKFPSIDWPYLDVINMDGTTASEPLFPHAVQDGGNYTPASATFTVSDNGLEAFDRVTLWYQNISFDYIVPNPANGITSATVAAELARQMNSANYGQLGAAIGLHAAVKGSQITVSAAKPGVDGNMIQLYQLNKNGHLSITPASANLSGGDSGAVWRITLDFTALGFADIRKMWLTFAPPLAAGAAYTGGDWKAEFTHWTLSGTGSTAAALQVAGLNTVRIQQNDSACTYSGTWVPVPNNLNLAPNPPDWRNLATGFYDQGFAARAHGLGSTARVQYTCAVQHDLYLGTSLAASAGLAGIELDGDTQTDLNCALANDDIVVTRRKVRSAVPAGLHVLTVVLKLGQYIDFNFLEAAVPSDIPAPLTPRQNLSPALDFDTDHTYKLPPARVLWILDQLGFQAPINEYLGVFWWNQRINVGGILPSLTVAFEGAWASGDSIFLDIGAPLASDPTRIDRTQKLSTISKSVFPADTPATIAAHFAAFINEAFSGVWAAAPGSNLTITVRSAAYEFALEVSAETQTTAGIISLAGSLSGGTAGDWYVDPTQAPLLNTGARAWHANFFALAQARGTEVVTALSMELVNPPSTFPARFSDGTAVATATGFGSYVSTHCALGGPILAFQKAALIEIAALQAAAGLTPYVQMGEFLWWYFSEPGGIASMAYYDADTRAAAALALGQPLHVFASPDDDPSVNGFADATFLRNRLRDHVASLVSGVRQASPAARCEVLLPLDVNFSPPAGPVGAQVGGQLNAFVNIPGEWRSQSTAGFDFLKIEALAFGSSMRSLDLARAAMTTPASSNWPVSARRYLVPVFGTASPWQKEVGLALTAGYSIVNLWALDHICLYGWDVTPGAFSTASRSSYQG